MYRFLLTPRWWGINVFVALSIPVCLFMGGWQLGRFEERVDSHEQNQSESVKQAQTAPLAELLPVDKETSGRTATASGRYDRQLLVPDRSLDGKDGYYVLTLLRTDDGKALPVVRGWLPGTPEPAEVPAPPAGEVTVTGALQASETQGAPGVTVGTGLPKGQLGMVSAAALINIVDYPVHDAWITLPEAPGALQPVPATAAQGTGLDLKAFQNLGYTAQWFVFVGFVIFMWFRFFRRELELAQDLALGISPEAPEAPDPEDPDTSAQSPAQAATA